MSDVERKDEQPEVEGHLQDEEERRPHLAPERAAARQGHARQGHPAVEEEGAEVEGHFYRQGPERLSS